MKAQLTVAALTVAVLGCSDATTGPAARRLTPSMTVSQDVQRVEIEETQVFPVPRGCTGEPVEWHLRQESILHERTDANGGFHGTFTFHDKGSYGVGLVTGAMYRLAQTQNESFNVGAGGLPMNDTAIFLRRFISQGSLPNFRVTSIFHFTIDANGNLTSSRNTSERICD
jgi:hypothetical protein